MKKQRVLLMISNASDRKVIERWLGQRFEVLTQVPPDAPASVDLCITDSQNLSAHMDLYKEWRRASEPLFLPFMLLEVKKGISMADLGEGAAIDEMVMAPVSQPVLQSRLVSLLRIRDMSQTLSQGKALYESLVERSLVGIYLIVKNRFLFANQAALAIFGLPAEALPTLDALSPFEKEDWPLLVEGRKQSPREGVFFCQVRVRRPSGELLTCEVYESALPHMGEWATVGAILDVTRREREEAHHLAAAQEEAASRVARDKGLEQAQARKRLFDSVSHELRTPLTAIQGYVEFLEDEIGGALTGNQREYVDQIACGVRRLEVLVKDVLDFTRLEAHTFQLDLTSLDFRNLVRQAYRVMLPLAQASGITLALQLPDEAVLVCADGDRLVQVLTNLIDNAIKFSAAGTTTTIRVEPGPEQVQCQVIDQGVGIAESELPKLFRAFSQPTLGAEKGGIGLGLSISKTIIEAHRGKIGALSKLGSGSTFWFTLPVTQGTGVSAAGEHAEQAPLKGGAA